MTGDGTSEGCDGEEKMLVLDGESTFSAARKKMRIAHKLKYVQNSKELWSLKKYCICFTFLSHDI